MSSGQKTLTCSCGHAIASDKSKSWCEKCGQPVFTDPKEKRMHSINSFCTYAVLLFVICFLTYIFLEFIAAPVLQWEKSEILTETAPRLCRTAVDLFEHLV